jgi:predicted SAM-dependent methyltransferase
MIKLNLGCGDQYLEGYVNCDILETVKVDEKFDLTNFPYPFEDNYADEILLDNVLEHLPDIVATMRELHRVLKPGGVVKIFVPYGKADRAIQDPTHVHFFTEKSMNYFTDGYHFSYYTTFRFRKIKAELFTGSCTKLMRIRNLIPFRALLKYFLFNMYDGVYFELEARK